MCVCMLILTVCVYTLAAAKNNFSRKLHTYAHAHSHTHTGTDTDNV